MPAPDAAWWPLEWRSLRAECWIGERKFTIHDWRGRSSTAKIEIIEIRRVRSTGELCATFFTRCPDMLSLRAALLAVAHPPNLPEDSGNPQE
jgi:hypothetical protein